MARLELLTRAGYLIEVQWDVSLTMQGGPNCSRIP